MVVCHTIETTMGGQSTMKTTLDSGNSANGKNFAECCDEILLEHLHLQKIIMSKNHFHGSPKAAHHRVAIQRYKTKHL